MHPTQPASLPRRRLLSCLLPMGLVTLCPSWASAQAAGAPGVEFSALLQAAMLPPKASTPPTWSQFNLPGIRWKSASPVEAPRAFLPIGRLYREGSLVLLEGGQPAYVDGRKRPGAWTLSLHGSAQGVVEWQLKMAQMADEPGPVIEDLQKQGFKLKARCEPDGVSSGAKVWMLGLPDKSPLVLQDEWSAGSAGMARGITVPYTRSRVAEAKCF